MGAIGGGIWHGIKGARNSPKVSVYGPSAAHDMRRRCSRGERQLDCGAVTDINRESVSPVRYLPSRLVPPSLEETSVFGVDCSRRSTVPSRATGRRRTLGTPSSPVS